MKIKAILIAIFSVAHLSQFAIVQQPPPVKHKKDTLRDIKNQPKPKYVKGRAARRRLQLRQIKQHEKQFKNVDSAEKKLELDQRKVN
jgi:hypothetical protein